MVILSEKDWLPPPPPYLDDEEGAQPPFYPTSQAGRRHWRTLSALPSHILLRIVYDTLPSSTHFPNTIELARYRTRVLYWVATSLRLVYRGLYISSMHILRSTYLPTYTSLIKPPYTSDPFPHSSLPVSSTPASIESTQRESKVLDLFLLLTLCEDVYADDTELHLERDDSFRDLFDFMQPRARLEDLVRIYAARAGLLALPAPAPGTAGGLSTPVRVHARAVPFSALSLTFSPRRAALAITVRSGKRAIADIPRTRDEPLERCASRLVAELQGWLDRLPRLAR